MNIIPYFFGDSIMKRSHVLSFVAAAVFLGLCTFLSNTLLNAQEIKPAKVLVFTRSQGFEHSPAKLLDDGVTGTGLALKAHFVGADKKIEIVETQDGGVFDGDLSQYDAFIFYTSGNLLNAEGSKNNRAKPMTEAGLRKLIAAVRAGKGFVGIHSATDTYSGIQEDGVDIYTKFVGARFTGHGPQQTATLTIVQPTAFPSLKEAGKSITLRDEWYAMNQFNKDMHVVLIQETEGMEGKEHYDRPPFPATWIRKEGQGRVAYTSLAHDHRYFTDNVRRISDLVEWAIGRFEADTTPNIDKVTPGAHEMPRRQ
jgi:type 1 glutamine amidotransferase